MKHTVCNQIRLEVDESELGATLSSTAMQHLRECGECQDFQNKQTKLRQIVGSLEAVNAPADFDFRLRARLASGEEHSGYQFLSSLPLLRSAGLAVVGLILLLIGSFVFVRQFMPRKQQMAETKLAANKEDTTSEQPETARENVNQASNVGASTNQPLAENFGTHRRRSVASKPNLKRATVTVDMGSTSAPVIRSSQSVAGMTTFPLDISQESFKVSIDDGRGTSRTISLPGVSFGARRVLTGRNVSHQFAPNGAW